MVGRKTRVTRLAKRIGRFARGEDGHTAVQYAVLLALLVAVSLAAVAAVGSSARETFLDIANYWQLGFIKVEDAPESVKKPQRPPSD